MMTHGNEGADRTASSAAQAPPSWALNRALNIVGRHGFVLANATTEKGRVAAAAGLALAIAKALSEAASSDYSCADGD